ncbi:hypothetical protein [Halorientalis pallida]|uniref:Uncharacterized protein n=1 Tax=Halorientalis pallida TaxID=2479928 RepID=A0A498KYT8_9EURY|nr:hypothetical protein [Halorientalis pallida]RXK51239.1 hypothetical protein EAF64_00930 [Halorientalis pallida]
MTLLLALAVVPATAAPPPESVCAPCQEGLEWAAHRHDIALDVTQSNATMRIHRNGSATWTATSQFAPGVPDRYATGPNESFEDPSALARDDQLARTIAAEAADHTDDTAPEEVRLQSVTVANDTIRFRFLEPTVARQAPGGVVLVDVFRPDGPHTGWFVDVNRLRVVGPPDTTLANEVESAVGDHGTVETRTLTFTGNATDPPALPGDRFFLAFAPPGRWDGPVATVAIASVTVPQFLHGLVAAQLVGAVALALALGAVLWFRRRRGESLDRDALVLWLGVAISLYLLPTRALFGAVYRPVGISLGPIPNLVRVVIAIAVGVGGWYGFGVLLDSDESDTVGSDT